VTGPPTDRSPAQRHVAEQASLAQAVVAGAADAIMATDLSGRVALWNGGCEALLGWAADDMVGRPYEILVAEDRRTELARAVGAVVSDAASATLETSWLHRSGEVVPVCCRLSPVRDRTGAVVGASAIVRDASPQVELHRALEEAQQLAEARFTRSVVAQATLAPDGTITDVNPALCRLSGYQPAQLLHRSVLELVPEQDLEQVRAGLEQLRAGRLPESRHRRLLVHARGHLVETHVSAVAVGQDSGAVRRIDAVIEDLSGVAAAERELRVREARWRSLETHSTDVAMFCDQQARALFVGASVTARFGYTPQDLIGADGFGFVHPEDQPGARAIWTAAAAQPLGATRVFETRWRHADGSWRWVEQSLTNALDDPAIGAMVVNLTEISERKSAEAVLDELAGTDTLTGLASRVPLMAALEAALASGAASTAVAIIDITRLKVVNDAYGHLAGDDVLVGTAARLAQAVEGRGVVARVGGDSFAALLTDVDEVSQVFEACGDLLAAVEEPLEVDGHRLLLTATVGAAIGPAVDGGALLASAEAALTTAKDGLAGPMHVVRAESASAAVSRARLIEDLRRGLDNDELVVHFQPIMGLADNRPAAAEALVRWLHPDKGLLSPSAFIDVAEDSGLIIDVGHVVLREACRAAARWAHVGHRGTFHVAVNLSARQLTRGDVVDVVRQALADSGAAPESLMLEVTESAVMSDVAAAVRALQELRDLGLSVAIDDFGTGYSSLTYLKQFPVTTLKIDRSFVSGLGKHSSDAAIVTSVINLARALGLDCIGEGVETEQQRLVLQAFGCTFGQGFLWSPGLDAATFETWLGSAATARRGPTASPVARAAVAARPGPTRHLPVDDAVLSRIADLGATGASFATIAAALNADAQLTPRGKRWTSRSVAQLMGASALQ
jgi:diguanylate cyclase (GGDEF)-like protein/PAS domain S-box-containing protein